MTKFKELTTMLEETKNMLVKVRNRFYAKKRTYKNSEFRLMHERNTCIQHIEKLEQKRDRYLQEVNFIQSSLEKLYIRRNNLKYIIKLLKNNEVLQRPLRNTNIGHFSYKQGDMCFICFDKDLNTFDIYTTGDSEIIQCNLHFFDIPLNNWSVEND
jgi:hypothetical protein